MTPEKLKDMAAEILAQLKAAGVTSVTLGVSYEDAANRNVWQVAFMGSDIIVDFWQSSERSWRNKMERLKRVLQISHDLGYFSKMGLFDVPGNAEGRVRDQLLRTQRQTFNAGVWHTARSLERPSRNTSK